MYPCVVKCLAFQAVNKVCCGGNLCLVLEKIAVYFVISEWYSSCCISGTGRMVYSILVMDIDIHIVLSSTRVGLIPIPFSVFCVLLLNSFMSRSSMCSIFATGIVSLLQIHLTVIGWNFDLPVFIIECLCNIKFLKCHTYRFVYL